MQKYIYNYLEVNKIYNYLEVNKYYNIFNYYNI